MLSVRLTSTVEEQLDFLSLRSGLSKNQIVAAALESYIKQQDLGSIPIKQLIQEARYDSLSNRMRRKNNESRNAILVANMAKSCGIWTAKPNPTGNPQGGIHGRNLVIGYAWSQDDKVLIVSKYLPVAPHVGADAYGLNITSYETWNDHMMECDIEK